MQRYSGLVCRLGLLACGLLCGCEGRATIIPNSDPNLNRTATQFAADAAKRFPYPGGAARGATADGRAEVDVMLGRLQVLNSSNEDWNDIDLWVNQSYVCHVPSIPMGKEKVESIDFTMLYNDQGHYFSTNAGKSPVTLIEMRRNGKVSAIPLVMKD